MTTHTSTPISIKIWVFCNDTVFCQNHTPHAFYQSSPPQTGVRLSHVDTPHHQVFALSDIQAQALGLDLTGVFLPYRQVISNLDTTMACELSAGIQLLRWQRTHQFCGCCSHSSTFGVHENVMICPQCHHHSYPRIQPCVIVGITRTNPITHQRQILLAQHHRHKHTGMYGLIAGFMEVGESCEMTIHREVLEEVGVRVDNTHYLKSQAWPYPTNLMMGFVADYVSGDIIIQEDELSHARFFDIDELPLIPQKGTIAFDIIQHIIKTKP